MNATRSNGIHRGEVEEMSRIYDLAVHTLNSGTREECDIFGKNLVFWIGNGHFAPNALAAILEEYRETYRIVHAPKTAVEGVRMEARTGRIHVDLAAVDRAERKREHPQGTFTVVFPDGQYETIKIETVQGGNFDGKTIASYLSGPDNETSFQGFAFVDDRGHPGLWRRFNGLKGSRKVEAVCIVLGAPQEGLDEARMAYAIRAGRCSRCGRKLTVPASLHRGMGPDCAGKG